MFRDAGILFLHAETPVHAGSGRGAGDVDLAIQREKHTGFPFIQAAGVKGAMRDLAEGKGFKHIELLFGSDSGVSRPRPGVLSFSEARILLFPVWSLVGVFGWVTCPAVLQRFHDDLALLDADLVTALQAVFGLSTESHQALVPDGTNLVTGDDQVVLPDLTLQAQTTDKVAQLAGMLARYALPRPSGYWAAKLKTDLVVVDDERFGDLVQNETEVISRVRIGDTGAVVEGPWDEEYLPGDALLYSLVLTSDPSLTAADLSDELQGGPAAVLGYLKGKFDNVNRAQIGGDEATGRGLVSVRFYRGEDLAVGEMREEEEG